MDFKLAEAIWTLCFIKNVFLKSFLVDQGQIKYSMQISKYVAFVSTYIINY